MRNTKMKMIEGLLGAMLTLFALALVGCAGTVVENDYNMGKSESPKAQVKWIDDNDLLFVSENLGMDKWYKKIGEPYYVEFVQDTVSMYYFYRPSVYQVNDETKTEHPKKESRRGAVWSPRTLFVRFLIVNSTIVDIALVEKPRNIFHSVSN